MPTQSATAGAIPTATAAPTYYESRGAGSGMTGALIGKQTKVADVEECKAKCTSDATCLSISFKATSLRCRLSSESAVDGNLSESAEYEAFEKIIPTLPTPLPTTTTAPTTTIEMTTTTTSSTSSSSATTDDWELNVLTP